MQDTRSVYVHLRDLAQSQDSEAADLTSAADKLILEYLRDRDWSPEMQINFLRAAAAYGLATKAALATAGDVTEAASLVSLGLATYGDFPELQEALGKPN